MQMIGGMIFVILFLMLSLYRAGILSFYLNSNIMAVEFFCYNARCSGT